MLEAALRRGIPFIAGIARCPGSETGKLIGRSKLTRSWDYTMLVPGVSGRINVNAVLPPVGRVFVCRPGERSGCSVPVRG